MKSFAEQLKAHRDRLGITQVKAAGMLGIGLRTYSIWEHDDDPRRKPHLLTQEGALARLRKRTRVQNK